MKVKELIEKLKELDPDKIITYKTDYGHWLEVNDVIAEQDGDASWYSLTPYTYDKETFEKKINNPDYKRIYKLEIPEDD